MINGYYSIVNADQISIAESILVAGATKIVQLRQKTSVGDAKLLSSAVRLRALCRENNALFIVNDRADIAMLANADGLHLGQKDLAIEDARRLVGDMMIGVSTHSFLQATEACARGANYIGFGPVFPTSTKENPDPVVGISQLTQVCMASSVPVVAIGGIDENNVTAVYAAGANAVCAISAVSKSADPALQAAKFAKS